MGGYPEWLDYSEDAYFHEQLLIALIGPHLPAMPPSSGSSERAWASVFRQFFRYMEGEALAGLHTGRNLLRFGCYITALLCLPLLLTRPVLLLLLIPFGLFYTSTSYKKFIRLKRYPLLGPALFVIPALMVFIDIAKMSGYIRGTFKLLRRPSSSTTRPNPNEI